MSRTSRDAPPAKFLSIAAAAASASLSTSTVKRLIKAGTLEAHRVGRRVLRLAPLRDQLPHGRRQHDQRPL